jgi:integrase
MRWSDVDLTNGLLRVRGRLSRVNGHRVIMSSKTERSRRDVPLSPASVALLRSVKASQRAERLKAASTWVETGLVFTMESGTAVDPRNALRAISTAAKALGMSGVGLHTLRHSLPRTCSRPACHCIPSRSCSGTPPSRSPGTCTVTSPPRARDPLTASDFSETASDLLLPVGMTGFEPATP